MFCVGSFAGFGYIGCVGHGQPLNVADWQSYLGVWAFGVGLLDRNFFKFNSPNLIQAKKTACLRP